MITKKVQRISPSGKVTEFESITEAAKSTPNACRELVGRAARRGVQHQGYLWEFVKTNGTPKPEPTRSPTMAITEDQLRSMHDIRSIVMNELKKLRKTEQGEFWRDADFVKRFQGKSGFRSILESPEAQPYRGKASGSPQVYWSHPESIQKMKNEGTLI